MKTTIDLPEHLVKKLKLRALQDGRTLREIAAEYLENGLATSVAPKSRKEPRVVTDKKTGLPVVVCPPMKSGQRQLTADDIANLLNEQEAGWVLGSS